MKGLPRSLARGEKTRRAVVKDTIILDGMTVTVTAVSTAIGFGSVVAGALPEGNILLLGAVANIGLAGSGSDANLAATWNGDYGVGTTPASDATITGADVDIIGSTAVGPATAEVIAATRATNATQAIIDNTAGTAEVNINVLIDAADITDDQSVVLTLSGRLDIAYIILGDD